MTVLYEMKAEYETWQLVNEIFVAE